MKSPLTPTIALVMTLAIALSPSLLVAQGNGGITLPSGLGNGGNGNGGSNNGNNDGNGGSGTGGLGGGLSADDAFSNVERGNTVGATESTGTSFSKAGEGSGGLGGGAGFGGFGGGFGGGLGGLLGGQGFGGGNANTKPVIRTRMRSAVEVDLPSASVMQRRASEHLHCVPARVGISGVNVTLHQQTAIMTGVVQSERDRRMSELLMRLEPGVRRVENRIIVMPTP